MTFDEFGFEDEIMDGLDAMNFREATPVQEKAIPVIMDGKDMIACAQTGTGKTAAFILPLMNRMLLSGTGGNKVRAIIVTPTRELAQQIDLQFEGFSYFAPISTVAVSGGGDGASWEQQKRGLKLGADVVIATPGRLISHLKVSNIDSYLPKQRQTLMFSATMPPKIRQLAKNILHDPVEVSVAVSKPNDAIHQNAYICYETQKIGIIEHIFTTPVTGKTIVFASSKIKCKEVAFALKRKKFKVAAMHSDLLQEERDRVMLDFKNNKIEILVATDIVARGIDIDQIELVINYDVPRDPEDYIHRIGRTARANAQGAAITFVSEKDQDKFARIEKFLGYEIEREVLPESLGEAPEYKPREPKKRRRGGHRGNMRRTAPSRSDSAQQGGKPAGREDKKRRSRKRHPRRNAAGGASNDTPAVS